MCSRHCLIPLPSFFFYLSFCLPFFIVIIIFTTTIALCSPTGRQASERASNRMSAFIETASILCPPSRQIAKKVEHILIYFPVHSPIHSFLHSQIYVLTHSLSHFILFMHTHYYHFKVLCLHCVWLCSVWIFRNLLIFVMLSVFSYFMKSWLSSGW